jgi:hypothetical protein
LKKNLKMNDLYRIKRYLALMACTLLLSVGAFAQIQPQWITKKPKRANDTYVYVVEKSGLCYSESDALVSFSQWELFNLPLAEAGFARTPALALNVCAHPEVTPFVFDSYEAIRDYLLQSTRLSFRSDGEKMHAYVSGRFRWEQNVQGLLDVIKSIVPEPSAKKPSFIKNLIWLFWEARESLRQNIYRKWVKRR